MEAGAGELPRRESSLRVGRQFARMNAAGAKR
jgi:hypothetical protein